MYRPILRKTERINETDDMIGQNKVHHGVTSSGVTPGCTHCGNALFKNYALLKKISKWVVTHYFFLHYILNKITQILMRIVDLKQTAWKIPLYNFKNNTY